MGLLNFIDIESTQSGYALRVWDYEGPLKPTSIGERKIRSYTKKVIKFLESSE